MAGDVTTIGSPGNCGGFWAGVCIIGTVLSADETSVLFIAELCCALSSCELIVHTPSECVSMSRVGLGVLRHQQQRLRVRFVSIFGVLEDIPHCSRARRTEGRWLREAESSSVSD